MSAWYLAIPVILVLMTYIGYILGRDASGPSKTGTVPGQVPISPITNIKVIKTPAQTREWRPKTGY